MPTLRVLVAHNYYQQRGGEDAVFEAEAALLRKFGHEVHTFAIHNDEVSRLGPFGLAKETLWSESSYRAIAKRVREFRPQVVHFHNTLPLISPSGYYAARENGAAVVQTLHNYRMACINGLFYRDHRVCEDCLTKSFPWPGIVHRCYRGSVPASVAVAAMLWRHRRKGTWAHAVDRYVVLSEFGKEKLLQAGLPPDKVIVKPNFLLEDPAVGSHLGGYALFAGRLSVEKGISVLLEAWRLLDGAFPLVIAGDGPLSDLVRRAQSACTSIDWRGAVSPAEVRSLMGDASFLIVPSTCYEGLPLTIVEAYGCGLPVLAADHGALRSIVKDEVGFRFVAGDSRDLAEKARLVFEHPKEVSERVPTCRREYEVRYTPAANIEALQTVYAEAIAEFSAKAGMPSDVGLQDKARG